MDNKVYYGEYTLMHWIDLILKKKIILPDYQRYFVWNQNKTKTLIETFRKNLFVPPITIGSFKTDDKQQNLIIDGQQRLTSILLSYLGIFPDKESYKRNKNDNEQLNFVNENDFSDEEEADDNILRWSFSELLKKGNTKKSILDKCTDRSYKAIDFEINEEFLKKNYLGFSYLVPESSKNDKYQQKYYSSVFRNINIQGEALLPQESRASLYYLDSSLQPFFDPKIFHSVKIKDSRADFVRYLSLLSQYEKTENINKVGYGYSKKMEKYYEEYIYSIIGENESDMFLSLSDTIKNQSEIYEKLFQQLTSEIKLLGLLGKSYTSIIDVDVIFFGLIYYIVFKQKNIKNYKKNEINTEIEKTIKKFKKSELHTKNPAALKYVRQRIEESIEIYGGYVE